jgi:hypothetical protein
MGMGVNGLGFRRSAKKFCRLRIAFPVRFLGKGKIFTVGLGFAGESFL